jgi:hypothetical protein
VLGLFSGELLRSEAFQGSSGGGSNNSGGGLLGAGDGVSRTASGTVPNTVAATATAASAVAAHKLTTASSVSSLQGDLSTSAGAAFTGEFNRAGNSNIVPENLAEIETRLWALLTSQAPLQSATVPCKADVSVCLRYYRRILTLSGWRMKSPRNASGLLLDFVGLAPSQGSGGGGGVNGGEGSDEYCRLNI